jgi:hypothetical protein
MILNKKNGKDAKDVAIKQPTLELFEGGMSTPDGLTGADDDPTLIEMYLVQKSLEAWNYPFARYNLFDAPIRFIQNEVVAALLRSDGDEAFPCLLVDGELKIKGRYPTLAELEVYTGIKELKDRLLPLTPEQVAEIKARSAAGACAGSCAGCAGCG